MTPTSRADLRHALVALLSIAGITAAYTTWLGVTNHTTVAVSYLLVVLFVAATSSLWAAIVTSMVAMLAFNFFFFPPVGTLAVSDSQNWIALFGFLAVSIVASRLSTVARQRQLEALGRRDELSRLFALSRDILLTTEAGAEALAILARHVAGRFQLDYVAICLPEADDFRRFEAGSLDLRHRLQSEELRRALSEAERAIEPGTQVSGGRPIAESELVPLVRLVPLRLGTRPLGVLAIAGRTIEPYTLDTLGSVVAIAIERVHFLEERGQAELAQRSAEFKSALLASLAHDLRTPLTTIRVAASNLHASWLTDAQREEQAALVVAEVERLTRLFENILEMTRIEAGAIAHTFQWVDPVEIVEAARNQIAPMSNAHPIAVIGRSEERMVRLDPRLTSAALARLLENAAQYSPAGSPITVSHQVTDEGLLVIVEDEGRGLADGERARLFEPFYRGEHGSRHATGTGMGLAIARGLLAAEDGRVWAENRREGGARFSIVVPALSRPAPEAAEES